MKLHKGAIRFRNMIAFMVLFSMMVVAPSAFALPEGEQVEAGDVTVERPNDTTLNVTAGNNAVINFNSFNIAQNETVNFFQPSASATCLSRVTGPDASQIFGTLNANGVLFLVNPNGINFAPSAQVNVNVLVASTLDISTNNFLNQTYIFEHDPDFAYNQIVNEGRIDATSVALIASSVSNTGIIQAQAGTVHLTSGDKVTVAFDMRGMIQVEINEETSGKVFDAAGNTVKDAVATSGQIEATQVILSAKTAKDIFEHAVNHTGVTKATKMVSVDGVIKIVANRDVQVSGTLEADDGIEVTSETNITSDKDLNVKGDITISTNNNIEINSIIKSTSGNISLFADYDGDGVGHFTQSAGSIETSGFGNILIDGSGTMTLKGSIITEYGYIKIGSRRAPESIEGNPCYVHKEGDFEITNKYDENETKVLETARGDILRYGSGGGLTLEARLGAIRDLTPTPIEASQISLIANSFDVRTTSPKIDIYRNLGDISITNCTTANGVVAIEGEGVKISYLVSSDFTLKSDGAIDFSETVILPAASVTLIANRFGTFSHPVTIDAASIKIHRLNGEIQIYDCSGLGTNVTMRGPPLDGWGAIVYPRLSHLTVEAESVVVSGSEPAYFYGDISFQNFTCTVPGKELYFEAGRTFTFTGSLHIEGQAGGYPVYLRSTVEGETWYIKVESETYSLIRVAVGESYNLGSEILYASPSLNKGGNTGWDLNTVYWIGAGGDDNWSTAANWDPGIPGASDAVVFDGVEHGITPSQQPNKASTMETSYTILSLTINGYTGATAILTLNGTLTCTDTTGASFSQSSGTIAGSGTIKVKGAVTGGAAGSWTGGTLEFNGGAAQVWTPGSVAWYNVKINNTNAASSHITVDTSTANVTHDFTYT
ncbi:MAG: filamentous hemagglutinin N-terminal domain-containing protein, partial [Candidatus Omnitrophica bacterium]|nr:filamentous hemagglutinin N-terminal domain-containing protein [Candidatus Omnitrophota bacterium]